jgi:hypothetical protein
MGYTGGGGLWGGAAREQPKPEAPHQEKTCALGWPKGQQTIAEDDTHAAQP